MKWFIIMSIIIIVSIIITVVCYKIILKKFFFKNYRCSEGRFKIKGKKNDFKIIKNGKIEFLIRDGKIVASRDLRVSKEFVYYGGGENGDY